MMGLARLRSVLDFSTPIGRVPRSALGPRLATAAIAILVLAIDAWKIDSVRHAAYLWRAVLAVVAIVLLWLVCRRDRLTLGLTLRTVQGAAWWWKATAVVAGVTGTVLVVLVGVLHITGNFRPVRLHPSQIDEALIHACLWAPLVEEALYRLVLAAPLIAVLRSGWVVLIAGVAFAGLHVLYGNPSPANAIGGFFMTWAYLKSGSLFVPILWHSAGNLFVIGTQVLAHEAL